MTSGVRNGPASYTVHSSPPTTDPCNKATLEAFNDVRNNRSLAHDNPILHYDEALLIFNHVASSIRFLRSVESRIQRRSQQVTFTDDLLEDIPF